MAEKQYRSEKHRQHLARLVLLAFILTFVAARVLVLLIMTARIADLFLYVGGTHIHHLNYGIFLLSAVGAYLLLAHPVGRGESLSAIIYGIGLALTFDEFGMWLHLGGPYWQRASFDAIVVISAMLGLASVAPAVRRFQPRHWTVVAVVVVALIPFVWLLNDSLQFAQQRIQVRMEQVEAKAR